MNIAVISSGDDPQAHRAQSAPITQYDRPRRPLNIVDGLPPIDAVTKQRIAALAALPSHPIRSDIR